jgi:hypothetical protein
MDQMGVLEQPVELEAVEQDPEGLVAMPVEILPAQELPVGVEVEVRALLHRQMATLETRMGVRVEQEPPQYQTKPLTMLAAMGPTGHAP